MKTIFHYMSEADAPRSFLTPSEMPDFNKKRNIVHLVLWIFAIITTCISAKDLVIKIDSGADVFDNQFCDAVVFGFLIVTSIMFGAICFDEEIPEKTLYLITFGGAVLYWAAGGLFVDAYDLVRGSDTNMEYRYLANGIICILLGFVYMFEFIVSLVKKDILE